MPNTLLTQTQVALQLGVSRWKVSVMTTSGELPCVRLGTNVRYLQSDVDALILRHYNGTHIGGLYLSMVGNEVQEAR